MERYLWTAAPTVDGEALAGLLFSFLTSFALLVSSSEDEDEDEDEEDEDEEDEEEELSLSLSLLLSRFFWVTLSSGCFLSLGGLPVSSRRWAVSGRSLLDFSTGLCSSRRLSADGGASSSLLLLSPSLSPPLARFTWSLSFSFWRPLATGEWEAEDKESRDRGASLLRSFLC